MDAPSRAKRRRSSNEQRQTAAAQSNNPGVQPQQQQQQVGRMGPPAVQQAMQPVQQQQQQQQQTLPPHQWGQRQYVQSPNHAPHQIYPTPPNSQMMSPMSANGMMGGGAGGFPAPAAAMSSEHRRSRIQQQLILLLHAHRCKRREVVGPTTPSCGLPQCTIMKEVLEHMNNCPLQRDCPEPHCVSSRQIIHHWRNCHSTECSVCGTIRRTMGPPESGPNFDNSSGFPPRLLPTPQPLQQQQQRGAPFNGDANNNLSNGGQRQQQHQQQLPPLDPPQTAPPVASNEDDWRSTVNGGQRAHNIRKVFSEIVPDSQAVPPGDRRVDSITIYAQRVENEAFEAATSRDDYFQRLAQKIFQIQTQLEARKNKRLQEQQQQPPNEGPPLFGQQPPMTPAAFAQGLPTQTPPVINGQQQRFQSPPVQPQFPYGSQQQTSQFQPNGTPQQHQQQQWDQGQLLQQTGGQADVPNPTSISPPNQVYSIPPVVPQQQPPFANNHGGMKGDTMEEHEGEQAVAKYPLNGRVMTPMGPPPSLNLSSASMVAASAPTTSAWTPTRQEKQFEMNELRVNLKPVLDQLHRYEESIPFRVPVNPVELGIPDYYDIIKNPMDMQTIGLKLDRGEYTNPWQFCDDFHQMFENAWLYNRKNTKVYKWCTKLSECFTALINPVMKHMGFCCGEKRSFTPLSLFCYGSMCTIARGQSYFLYEGGNLQFGMKIGDKYIYCTTCFDALPPSGLNLNDDPSGEPNWVAKDQFQFLKNDRIEYEPFELCVCCARRWHRLCALHHRKIQRGDFTCPGCRLRFDHPPAENPFTARRLPTCHLSDYIETRVRNYMHEQRAQHEVVVRVLNAADKELEVKPKMRERYSSAGFPTKFPYKSKAIFAFQVIDNVEVCFFGFYVQEFDSRCPAPNSRRVYIAYLDSVHYFEPRELRTAVYHEIILGYIAYVGKLGYTWTHLWACPPSEGDDYIFHCHPVEQRIPKQKRLQEWYKKMLEKGREAGIVHEYKDIWHQAKDDKLRSPTEMPYFEGDFWPNMIEDAIRATEKEENDRRLSIENDQAEADKADSNGGDGNRKQPYKKKSQSKKKNTKKKLGAATGNEVTDKLFHLFEKHKDVFFTIRLVSPETEAQRLEHCIHDFDPPFCSELMETRDAFMGHAREVHWEFSSLRRARYSTLSLCYELHQQDQSSAIVTTCNKCSKQIENKWHCTVCEDYDLCSTCYQSVGHEHKMEEVRPLVVKTVGNANTPESHLPPDQMQSFLKTLQHSAQCRDANCRRSVCPKFKKIIAHVRGCRANRNVCNVCKQYTRLVITHARLCTTPQCTLPFCSVLRAKLEEQQRARARRADMMMRRRMGNLGTLSPSAPSSTGVPQSPAYNRQLPPATPTSSSAHAQMFPPNNNQMPHPNNQLKGEVGQLQHQNKMLPSTSRADSNSGYRLQYAQQQPPMTPQHQFEQWEQHPPMAAFSPQQPTSQIQGQWQQINYACSSSQQPSFFRQQQPMTSGQSQPMVPPTPQMPADPRRH